MADEKGDEPADESAAMARDAARYRWLRDGHGYAPEEAMVTGGVELDALCDEGIERDAIQSMEPEIRRLISAARQIASDKGSLHALWDVIFDAEAHLDHRQAVLDWPTTLKLLREAVEGTAT